MSLRQIQIDECHHILLQIADCFDRICQTHNIPYYMLGGTMLGAIRHKGFIPWDDDMDFGIPRPFFDKFQQIANKELPKEYQIVTRHNSPTMHKGFIKIQLQGSKLFESVFGELDEAMYNGIAIDVFPLDGADTESIKGKATIKLAFILQRIQEARFCSLDIRTGVKRIVASFLKKLPVNDKKLADKIEKLIQKVDYKSSKNAANFYGHWREREIISQMVFGSPIKYQFDTIELCGVQNYDAYLKSLYGDYMKLPPKEQQITHAQLIFVAS